jgi:aminoglycoside phosphotransferase (APT) family kinase protein
VVGAPFYIMERVEGRMVERSAMYASMVQTMARLHGVDWAVAGLAQLGEHGNFSPGKSHAGRGSGTARRRVKMPRWRI